MMMKRIKLECSLIFLIFASTSCAQTPPPITSFESCVAVTGKVLRSYPAQCIAPNGDRFTESIKKPTKLCVDKCGDGVCAEIVCMAEGCPCAESSESCAKDCAEQPSHAAGGVN